MSKKKIKNKDGSVFGIEVTGKDAKDLHNKLKEEAENHDTFLCEKCKHPGIRLHKKQKNGKWKCTTCGNKVAELDRLLARGCEWFERVRRYKEATDKVFGKIKL